MNKSTIVSIIVLIILILVLIFVPVNSTTIEDEDNFNSFNGYTKYNRFCESDNEECIHKPTQIMGLGKFELINKEKKTCKERDNFDCSHYVSESEMTIEKGTCYEYIEQEEGYGKNYLVAQHKLGCELKRESSCPYINLDLKGLGKDYLDNQEKIRDPCY